MVVTAAMGGRIPGECSFDENAKFAKSTLEMLKQRYVHCVNVVVVEGFTSDGRSELPLHEGMVGQVTDLHENKYINLSVPGLDIKPRVKSGNFGRMKWWTHAENSFESVAKGHLQLDLDIPFDACDPQQPMQEAKSFHIDCSIEIDGSRARIGAHRFILAARSDFFAAAFRSEMLEGTCGQILLRGTPFVSVCALQSLLSFIYRGKLPEDIRDCEAAELLGLVDTGGGLLQLHGNDQICQALMSRLVWKIDSTNALSVLRRCFSACAGDVHEIVLDAMLEHLGKNGIEFLFDTKPENFAIEHQSWWSDVDEISMLRKIVQMLLVRTTKQK